MKTFNIFNEELEKIGKSLGSNEGGKYKESDDNSIYSRFYDHKNEDIRTIVASKTKDPVLLHKMAKDERNHTPSILYSIIGNENTHINTLDYIAKNVLGAGYHTEIVNNPNTHLVTLHHILKSTNSLYLANKISSHKNADDNLKSLVIEKYKSLNHY